jgi:hypothetical protein
VAAGVRHRAGVLDRDAGVGEGTGDVGAAAPLVRLPGRSVLLGGWSPG